MSTLEERAREKARRRFEPSSLLDDAIINDLASEFTAFAASELALAKVPEMREALQSCLDMVDKDHGPPNWDTIRAILSPEASHETE